MSTGLLIFGITIGIVGFFVLAFSLTILFKGHYMDSEIGTNPHMKERGIGCASQQFRNEEAALKGTPATPIADCGGNCGSCAASYCEQPEDRRPRKD